MRWIDILNELEYETWADIDDFTHLVGLEGCMGENEEWERRVKKYFVRYYNWICTDTRVGLAVYKFDGEVVAVSHQPGRKYYEDIQFISQEVAVKVKDFILSLTLREYPIIDLNSSLDLRWYFNPR